MRTLRRCSALILASLCACAEQHEGRVQEPDPPQTGDVSRSDDGAEAARDRADHPTSPPSEDEPEPALNDADAATPRPATPTPAWSPVLASFPGRNTGVPDICARKIFDSLSPGDRAEMSSPCTYRPTGWSSISDPRFLRVTVGGVDRRLGQADDGWMVAPDGRSVTLLGAACEAARAGTSIEFQSECMPVPAW